VAAHDRQCDASRRRRSLRHRDVLVIANLAAAYVIAIDTSASMNNYQNDLPADILCPCKSLANALAKQLGPTTHQDRDFDQDDTPST